MISYLTVELLGQESHLLNDQPGGQLGEFDNKGRYGFRPSRVVGVELLVPELPKPY